jgi:carboxypeptidase PM20D1
MKTGAIIAEKLAGAEMVLNMDGSGGKLDEHTNTPLYFTWEAAEKTYADFQLKVTNPGGHSSEPRKANAITQLAAALVRIGKYQFLPELNDLTRAYFEHAAEFESPAIAAAMRAFAENPIDRQAIATLTANPATIGKIGTTCVATMISGGHALNALPQSAEANVNCRIFPGHDRPAVLVELVKIAADPAVHITDVTAGSVSTPASPLRPDVAAAVKQALAAAYPGVALFPSMSSGASDSMWFRYHDVPSYGISPIFIKASDNFSHGLNERTPVAAISPAVTYCVSLFRGLSG